MERVWRRLIFSCADQPCLAAISRALTFYFPKHVGQREHVGAERCFGQATAIPSATATLAFVASGGGAACRFCTSKPDSRAAFTSANWRSCSAASACWRCWSGCDISSCPEARWNRRGLSASQVTVARPIDPTAAMAMMTLRLNRIARGGRERRARLSGSSLAGDVAAASPRASNAMPWAGFCRGGRAVACCGGSRSCC